MSLFAVAKQAKHQAAAMRSFDDGGRSTHAWHRAGSGDSLPSCDSGCGLLQWSDAGTFFPPGWGFSIAIQEAVAG